MDANISLLPKFLIGDTSERTFVIHLHNPRFIAEVHEDWDGDKIIPHTWFDTPSLQASELSALLREAGDFYVKEIEREINLD